MASEQAALNALPADADINGISDTFNNPAQMFKILDKNNDGRITNDDLQLLLQQYGITGIAAKIVSKYLFDQLDANDNGSIETSDLANAANILWKLFQQKQNTLNQ